jgi:hypothetical protein
VKVGEVVVVVVYWLQTPPSSRQPKSDIAKRLASRMLRRNFDSQVMLIRTLQQPFDYCYITTH